MPQVAFEVVRSQPESALPPFPHPPVLSYWYPWEMLRTGQEGIVLVSADVALDGTVSNVVVQESTHRQFEEAVARRLPGLRFLPARYDRAPVATHIEATISFSVE